MDLAGEARRGNPLDEGRLTQIQLEGGGGDRVGWSVADALGLAVSADTDVVADIPPHVTISMHVCRGNNQSRYLCEGPLDELAEELFSLPYDRFLIEWEDPDRMGGFEALRAVPRGGPIVVLGIVSSKRAALESVDEIAVRVDEASRRLPIDQLAISTQCGCLRRFLQGRAPRSQGATGR